MKSGNFEARISCDGRQLNELVDWPDGIARVTARPGTPFCIDVTNHSSATVLAVATVDGLSTYTGKSEGFRSPGYLVSSNSMIRIKGFRIDDSRQVPFEFASDVTGRQAARFGSAAEIGIVRVGVFQEKSLTYDEAMKELGQDLRRCREAAQQGEAVEKWVLANAKDRLWIWLQLDRVKRPEAVWLVGVCKRHGCCMKRDPADAVRRMQEAARRGVPWALLSLGDCFRFGVGPLMQDDAMARRWYENAAKFHVDEAADRLRGQLPSFDDAPMRVARFVRANVEPQAIITFRCIPA